MAKDEKQSGNLVCSFCQKSQNEVRKLIAGPTVYICDECSILCLQIISREGLNLRAAYFCFEFVARLLYPIALLFDRSDKSN